MKRKTIWYFCIILTIAEQTKSSLQKGNHRGTEECLQRKRSGCVASHIQSSLTAVGAVVERGGEGSEGDEEDDGGGEVGGWTERRHPRLLLGDNWRHAALKYFRDAHSPMTAPDRDGKTVYISHLVEVSKS